MVGVFVSSTVDMFGVGVFVSLTVDVFGVGVFVSLTVDMFGQKKEGDDVWFGRCRPASHRLVPNTKM